MPADSIFLKCSSKGCKAPGKGDQTFDFAPTSGEGKMRSLRSLHERWSCFTLKRPRTSWGRPHSKLLAKRLKGGPNVHHQGVGYGGGANVHHQGGIGHGGGRGHLQHELRNQGKETLMESGLIQKFPLYCENYGSSSLSLSSNSQEKAVMADSSSSSGTNMGSSVESSASLDNCASCGGDGFSTSDEVMSLVDCSEMEGVLDFMASTMDAHCTVGGGPDTCEREGVVCGTTSSMESKEEEEEEDDDGEPYRIDLCDFEPDLNAPTYDQPLLHGSESGVLCLRLDYEEVLRAWKDCGACLWAGGTPPPYHPITLDGFHTFAHALPPHPSYC